MKKWTQSPNIATNGHIGAKAETFRRPGATEADIRANYLFTYASIQASIEAPPSRAHLQLGAHDVLTQI
jgi:hypothetical protein